MRREKGFEECPNCSGEAYQKKSAISEAPQARTDIYLFLFVLYFRRLRPAAALSKSRDRPNADVPSAVSYIRAIVRRDLLASLKIEAHVGVAAV